MGARQFVALRRLTSSLAILRQAGEPYSQLMAHLLELGSEAWLRKSHVTASRDGQQKYRVLECASGVLTGQFFSSVRARFFGPHFWNVVPAAERNESENFLVFKALSSGAGCVEALLSFSHKRYPFRGFLLLSQDRSLRDKVSGAKILGGGHSFLSSRICRGGQLRSFPKLNI